MNRSAAAGSSIYDGDCGFARHARAGWPSGYPIAMRWYWVGAGHLYKPCRTACKHWVLVDVFRFYLDHQGTKPGKRHRPHLNVVIDHHDLLTGGPGRTLEGLALDATTLRRLACDANVHRVITDGASSILDYGRATRTIPPALYTSLVLRDMGCRYPGCDRKPEWCEGHHIHHWEPSRSPTPTAR